MLETWQKIFIRKLFHYDVKRMDIEGAFMAKFHHVPDKLYKYRGFSENHKSAFLSGQLWTASADKLNDPNECGVYFRPDAMIMEDLSKEQLSQRIKKLEENSLKPEDLTKEKIIKPIRSKEFIDKIIDQAFQDNPHPQQEEIKKAFVSVSDHLNQEMIDRMATAMRAGFGVLSLSAVNNNTLMWSHYSNSHTGFVIEYDFDSLPYENLHKRTCFPVFYSSKKRDVTRYICKPLNAGFNNLFGQYLAMIKDSDWSYEKEWRIVTAIGSEYATQPISMPHPSGIILGAKCSVEDQDWMIKACKELKILLRKVSKIDRYGKFELEDIS